MVFEEKRIILKNGQECILRSPEPEDAEAILSHFRQTTEETNFMISYPEEVTISVKDQKEFLKKNLDDPKSLMISALVDGKIVADAGYGCIMDKIKYRHRAVFGISVQKEYWGLGIGTTLLTELIGYAEKVGYEQLELEVDCENDQAVRLYQKLGFNIYGIRERSFKFEDGTYSSFYLMLRRLQPAL